MPRTTVCVLSSFVLIWIAGARAESLDGPHPQTLLDETIRQLRPPATASNASIRVDVDLTLVPVTVTDQYGRNVQGLNRQNFRIYDGSGERPIVSFSRTDAPVSIGLVFDSSRSMKDKLNTSHEAVRRLFSQLNPDDEACLVTISDRAEVRRKFTSNAGDIGEALTFLHPDGSTSLLDGIYLALAEMRKAHNPRKAIIVVSDGGDNNSRYTLKELLRSAIERDVLIYTIGIFQNPQSIEEVQGPELLRSLAEKTGGMSFPVQSADSVGDAMSTIGGTLHNQYMLGYYPPEDAPSGKYRKIKVQLQVPKGMPRLQIYARSGYYVP